MAKENKNIKLSKKDKNKIENLAKQGLCTAYIAAEIGIAQEDLELNYMTEIHKGRAKIWFNHSAEIFAKMEKDHNFFRMMLPIIAPELVEAETKNNSNTVHVKIHKSYKDKE